MTAPSTGSLTFLGGTNVLDVYRDALRHQRPQFLPTVTEHGMADLYPPDLRTARSTGESRVIDSGHGPRIAVSASGMATGGRVVHHLETTLPDPRNTVLIVGYAAAGTRARDLVEGAKSLKTYGHYVPVRARVADITGLSAHAEYLEVLSWLGGAPAPATTCVVHGEEHASDVLRDRIADQSQWTTVVPKPGERVLLP